MTWAGAVAAVAVLSVGVAMLPNLGEPTVGGGTAAEDEVVDETEALARCRAQWERDSGSPVPPVTYISGDQVAPGRHRVHTSIVVDYPNYPGFLHLLDPRTRRGPPGPDLVRVGGGEERGGGTRRSG